METRTGGVGLRRWITSIPAPHANPCGYSTRDDFIWHPPRCYHSGSKGRLPECGRRALRTVACARKQSPTQMQEFESLLLEDEICSKGGPTQTFQDLAVLVLLGTAGFSLAKLVFKLAIVTWALAAAGIRYIILGIILLLVVAML